jgi:ABC-type dipeptide/oligopeptide/nickel transport system permease component
LLGFGYAAKRILDAGISIFLVMIVGFFMFYWGTLWGDTSSASALVEAFVSYANLIIVNGFGDSSRYGMPVLQVVGQHATYTILLLGIAIIASVLIGTLAGLISAWRRDRATDRYLTVALLIPFAVPTVWIAETFLYLFCYKYPLFPLARSFSEHWIWEYNFPPSNTSSLIVFALEVGFLVLGLAVILSRNLTGGKGTRWAIISKPAIYAVAVIIWTYLIFNLLPSVLTQFALDVLWHLFVPCTILILAMLYLFFLTARNSSIAVLSENYILTAKAKGLRNSTILVKHAFRNSMLPTIALVAQSMTLILGLELVVEIVFTWNGLGMLIYDVVNLPYFIGIDYPVLIGVLFILAAVVTLGNAVSDIATHYLDPALRRAREIEAL